MRGTRRGVSADEGDCMERGLGRTCQRCTQRRDSTSLSQELHSARSTRMEQNMFRWTLHPPQLNLVLGLGREGVRWPGHLSGIEVRAQDRGSFWQ